MRGIDVVKRMVTVTDMSNEAAAPEARTCTGCRHLFETDYDPKVYQCIEGAVPVTIADAPVMPAWCPLVTPGVNLARSLAR